MCNLLQEKVAYAKFVVYTWRNLMLISSFLHLYPSLKLQCCGMQMLGPIASVAGTPLFRDGGENCAEFECCFV